MILRFLAIALFLSLIPIGNSPGAENKEDIDPSNPTQLNTSLNAMYEFQNYNADGKPRYQNHIGKIEGQAAGPGFLFLGEIGYGFSSLNDDWALADSRLRFFHLPYSNDSPDSWLNAFGWSIDTFLPTGDYHKGLGSGSWVIAPGVVSAHNYGWGALYPNLMYQYTIADDDVLKQQLAAQGEDDTSHAVKIDLNISPKMPEKWWLMITPAYTWGIENADDGSYIRIFTGRFITDMQALGFEGQYNMAVRDEGLNSVIDGQDYYVKLMYQNYF